MAESAVPVQGGVRVSGDGGGGEGGAGGAKLTYEQKSKLVRDRKKELGICAFNGCNDSADEGFVVCHKHREYFRDANKKWKDNRISNGICFGCPNSSEGYAYCEECRSKGANRRIKNLRELRSRRLSSGLCAKCCNPNDNGFQNCDQCRSDKNAKAALNYTSKRQEILAKKAACHKEKMSNDPIWAERRREYLKRYRAKRKAALEAAKKAAE